MPDVPVMPGILRVGFKYAKLDSLLDMDRFPNVEQVDVDDTPISSFEGLEACPNVKRVSARRCRPLGSLRGLQNARELEELDVSMQDVYWGGEDRTPGRLASLRGLENCTSLVKLDATGNAIASTAGLGNCAALDDLVLWRNQVERVEGLEGCSRLRKIKLAENPLASLDGIEAVAGSLVVLDVSKTRVSSLEPLRAFSTLARLEASNTPVNDLEPLRGCEGLEKLIINDTPVERFDALRGLPRLRTIEAGGTGVTSLDWLPAHGFLDNAVVGGPNLQVVAVPPHVRSAIMFGVSSSPVSSFSIEAPLDVQTLVLESTTPITSFHFPPHVLPPGAYLHLTYEQSRMSSEELLAYMRWLLPNVPAGSATWKELCQVTGAARIDCEDPVFREWEREWRSSC